VIVSDIGLPGQSGYEFLHRARKTGCTSPAIALTAFARPQDRLRALKAGCQMHLVEPVELAASVASLVGRSGPT
jgi:CheY-like chemotaxis protein